MADKIRIFDTSWKIGYQLDMISALKNDCEFTYCLNLACDWGITRNVIPGNLKFATHYEAGRYDVALLHIDQESVLTDQKKRLAYDQFNLIIQDIPKIVINHGAPVYSTEFEEFSSVVEMKMKCADAIRQLVGDSVMIVSSHTAASDKEWGFGFPLVSGSDVSEWLDLPKEPRVFTALPSQGLDAYYNSDCLVKVYNELYNKYGYIPHYADANVETGRSTDSFKEFLGRSLLYLDTSFRTPLNRARTGALLSGCCVIQVEEAHDLDRWAKHDENILIVKNDPSEIASLIADILDSQYQKAVAIGKAGKEMAKKVFSPERYRLDWLELLKRVLNR